MTSYRIKDFESTFTKRDTSRLVRKRLPWVALPTSLGSRAFRRISRLPNGAAIYGAFIAMVCVVASSGTQGRLEDDKGVPLTAIDLEDLTGLSEVIFREAFAALSDPSIGWLEPLQSAGKSAGMPQPAADCAKSAAGSPKSAAGLTQSAEKNADSPNLRCTDGTDGTDGRTADRNLRHADCPFPPLEDTNQEPVSDNPRQHFPRLIALGLWLPRSDKDKDQERETLAELILLHGIGPIHAAAERLNHQGSDRFYFRDIKAEVASLTAPAATTTHQDDDFSPLPECQAAMDLLTKIGPAEVNKTSQFQFDDAESIRIALRENPPAARRLCEAHGVVW